MASASRGWPQPNMMRSMRKKASKSRCGASQVAACQPACAKQSAIAPVTPERARCRASAQRPSHLRV